MPTDAGSPHPPPDPKDRLELTDVVKSRIIDRVLRELAEESPLGFRQSLYTRSSVGVYGKYEKYDADVPRLIEEIRGELERMVSEQLEERDRQFRAEGASSDETGGA